MLKIINKTLINPSRPDPGQRQKINIFKLLCGALKGFMRALKVPQRSVKINFISI